MSHIRVSRSTVLYRDPVPGRERRHAFFPSLVSFPDGEMLCSVVLGSSFESVDCRVHLCRSKDEGGSWELEQPTFRLSRNEIASYSARLSLIGETLILLLFRFDRSRHPEMGLTNPATLGFVPQSIYILRSVDRGRHWSEPEEFIPPVEGPCFELCSPIKALSDGRWIWPTHTWMDWDGNHADGPRMMAFISKDGGRRWQEFMDVMDGRERGWFFWESKVVETARGKLVAVAWTYDRKQGCDLENHWTFSNDGGKSWSPPAPTGLQGQTVDVIPVSCGGGEALLCVYRRTDRPGLWAALVDVGEHWEVLGQSELWSGSTGMMKWRTMSENFANLRFGAPSLCRLPNGRLLCAFWCCESCLSNIRLLEMDVVEHPVSQISPKGLEGIGGQAKEAVLRNMTRKQHPGMEFGKHTFV